jgi:hypothetical protein
MGILDKSFKYVPASKTDIAKTFAKERKRLAEIKAAQEQAEAEQTTKVRKLKQEKA